MTFKKYPSIERFGHEDNKDIFLSNEDTIVIEEKVDGGNGCFWQEEDGIHFGSRNRDLTLEKDTKMFAGRQIQLREHLQELETNEIKLNPDYMYYCFSEDTEILTNNGWKYFNNLNKNTIYLTFNKEENKLEYQKANKLFIYDYNGIMHNIEQSTISLLVTPNHRVLFDYAGQKRKSNWRVREIKDLPKYDIKIPSASIFNGKENINQDFLRILAWVITEGHIKPNKVIAITQSADVNFENVMHIRKLMNKLNFTYNYNNKDFEIDKENSSKIIKYLDEKIHQIPKNLLSLNTENLKILFEELMRGDGHINKKYPSNMNYATKSEILRDQVQELCVKIGLRSCYKLLSNKWGKWFSIQINGKNYCSIRRKDIKEVKYNGKIWCPSTKNGFVIIRRKGKISISGNCEWMEKHTINYTSAPFIIGIDIRLKRAINSEGFGLFLGRESREQEFNRLKIENVPLIWRGTVKEIKEKPIRDFIPKSKYFDGFAEGIVIKNYNRKHPHENYQLYAKLVRDEFKEDNKAVFGNVKNKHSDTSKIIEEFCTEARVRKGILKLTKEEGLKLELKLMAKLPTMITKDILKEEFNTIYDKYKFIDFKEMKQLIPKICLRVLREEIENEPK